MWCFCYLYRIRNRGGNRHWDFVYHWCSYGKCCCLSRTGATRWIVLSCSPLLSLLTTAPLCFDAEHSYVQYFVVNGEAENYFVAGHSLPLWIVAMTLGAQSVDSNSLLGNVDLSYKFHFYDGAGKLKDSSS
jgi:hypothetical protein